MECLKQTLFQSTLGLTLARCPLLLSITTSSTYLEKPCVLLCLWCFLKTQFSVRLMIFFFLHFLWYVTFCVFKKVNMPKINIKVFQSRWSCSLLIVTYSKNVSTSRCCIVFQFVQIAVWFNWKQQATSERHLIWPETMVANNGKNIIFPKLKISVQKLAKQCFEVIKKKKISLCLFLLLNRTHSRDPWQDVGYLWFINILHPWYIFALWAFDHQEFI